jgi:hypothetical protein
LSEIQSILRKDGIFGLYRGYMASLASFGPYVSIYFALYEQWKIAAVHVRRELGYEEKSRRLPLFFHLTGAGLSSAVSATVTCPLDVIKTRIQVTSSDPRYRNWASSVWTIYRSEGWDGFFRGVRPRCLWMSTGTAITMMFYEWLKEAMGGNKG